MALVRIILPLVLALSFLTVSLAGPLNQQPLAPAVSFRFRDARAEDAGDIATVVIDAFSQAPVWKYIHQFEDEHPGYLWKCYKRQVEDMLADGPPKANPAKVLAVPDETTESGSRVVSISAWELNSTSASTEHFYSSMLTKAGNCWQRLDTNTTRLDQYVHHLESAKKTYLDEVFDRQFHLLMLATHPKWDGHDFAAVHLRWGLDLANNLGLPTTLLATAAGYPLYKSFGFEDVYNDTIHRLDGKGVIWHEVMKHTF